MKKLTFRAMRTINVLVIMALVAGLIPTSPTLAARTEANPVQSATTETPADQTSTPLAGVSAPLSPSANGGARFFPPEKATPIVTSGFAKAGDMGRLAPLGDGTFFFDTFNPITPGWSFHTTSPCSIDWYVYVTNSAGSDDTFSLLVTEQASGGDCWYGNYDSWATKTVSVPLNLETLYLSYDIRRCDPGSPYGAGRVYVDGQVIYGEGTPTVWTQKIHDITSYASDGSVELKFLVPALMGNRHCMLIDRVILSTYPPPPPLPPDRTYAPEDPCLANNPQASAADPVNTRTGNFTHQAADVAIPTRGRPLTFERSYNSLDTYTGPLGRGWTHSCNMHLTVEGATVTLMAPRGSRLRFTDEGGGTFTAGPGIRATLVRKADDTYTLTRGDQIAYTFDANGRLTALADTHANTTTLTYTGNNLTAITSSDGRALTLTYDGQGRLTQLTDPLNRTVGYTYDANGNLATVTDRRGGVTTYAYDAEGRLTSFTDPKGHAVTNSYDAQGRVSTQTDALDQATTFTYEASQTVVTDPNGHATTHTYDTTSRLESVADALGNTTTYTYDEDHNLATVTDPLDRTTSFTWSDCGCGVTSVTDPLDQMTSFVYDERNNLISYTDPLSRTMALAYDGQDNLTVITNTLGVTVTFAYDAYGQMLTSTDANGRTTGYAYDGYGNLTTITNSLSYVTDMSYDLAGRLTQITNPKSQITQYEYDPGDNLVKITDALDGETTYGYDAVGNTIAITDANSHSTALAYDDADRLITTTSALGAQTVYGYDPAGNLTQITNPQSQITYYQYDAADRLTAVVDPLGNATQYGYDAVGNLTVITDANDIVTHHGYDVLNRLTSVIENYVDGVYSGVPDEDVITRYGYDAVGNRTTITNARGYAATYTYDPLNRLETVRDPLNHTWSYTYDPVGNLTQLTDPKSQIAQYQYDALNRLTGIDYPAPQGDVSFTYDAVGNRLTMADPTGTTSYVYDALNRLTSAAHPGSGTVGYGYDAVGNRTQISNPQSQITNYQYDAANRLETVADWSSGQYTYTYDAAGRLTGLDAPTGVKSSYHYDEAGRLTCLDHTAQDQTLASYRYTLDDAGNRLQAEEGTTPCLLDIYLPIIMKNASGGGTMGETGGEEGVAPPVLPGTFDSPLSPPTPTPAPASRSAGLASPLSNHPLSNLESPLSTLVVTYTYDSLYRLTGAEYSTGESFAYTYDAVGNRLSLVTSSGSTSYEYDAADRLTSVNGVGYTWDDNGNLQSDGTRTYSYDAADRLTGVSGGGVNASYTYNGDGLRVGQTIDGAGMTFTWDVAALLPQVLATSDGAAYVYGLGLLAQQQAGAWQYPLADGLGSVRQWTDASSQVTYAARYAPFGSLLWQQGSPPGPWGFAGEFQDPTGLIYLRARWYDPATGRFLTRDPFPGLATLPTTQHPYVYVGNNPVNLTDPSGEFAFVIPLLLGAAIGGGFAAYNYWQTQPCATFPSALSDPAFQRAVGIGMLTGAVGGLIGFGVGIVGAGAFGGGLAGAIISGAVGGGLAGGAMEAVRQAVTYGHVHNPQLVGAAMLSGVVSGGVLGGVGYGLSGRNTLWRVLRQRQIRDGAIAPGAFRVRGGESGLSVFRGPGWLVKTLVRLSPKFRDVGGFARLSRMEIVGKGIAVVPEIDPNLGLLGIVHENVLYPAGQMSKGEFDRLLLGLVRSLE